METGWKNVGFDIQNVHHLTFCFSVYRINWLRAKARLNRWEEELELVVAEMGWTVATFKHNAGVWHKRAVECLGNEENRGKQSYALQQESNWLRWAAEARITFFEE
jgi:hypothetical protein